MTTPFKALIRLAAALATLPLLSGCLTTYGVQEQQMAQQEDMAILQEKIRRMEGHLEGYNLAIEQLQRAVEVLQAQPRGPSAADLDALQTRLAAFDGQMRNLDAARQRDRQEIIDTLSAKIAALVSASGSGRSTAKPAASPGQTRGHPGGLRTCGGPGRNPVRHRRRLQRANQRHHRGQRHRQSVESEDRPKAFYSRALI
jgi:DNA-binding FrmR family transcriptional regulator